MELIFLDLAGVNFVKLLMSLGEIMFFNRINGKCQLKQTLHTLYTFSLVMFILLLSFLFSNATYAEATNSLPSGWHHMGTGTKYDHQQGIAAGNFTYILGPELITAFSHSNVGVFHHIKGPGGWTTSVLQDRFESATYMEDFEQEDPQSREWQMSGWHRCDDPNCPSIIYASVFFDSDDANDGETLITPPLDLTVQSRTMLKFMYWNPSGGDYIDVRISTDGGISYELLGEVDELTNPNGAFKKVYFDLEDFNDVNGALIKFTGHTGMGSAGTFPHIDNVQIVSDWEYTWPVKGVVKADMDDDGLLEIVGMFDQISYPENHPGEHWEPYPGAIYMDWDTQEGVFVVNPLVWGAWGEDLTSDVIANAVPYVIKGSFRSDGSGDILVPTIVKHRVDPNDVDSRIFMLEQPEGGWLSADYKSGGGGEPYENEPDYVKHLWVYDGNEDTELYWDSNEIDPNTQADGISVCEINLPGKPNFGLLVVGAFKTDGVFTARISLYEQIAPEGDHKYRFTEFQRLTVDDSALGGPMLADLDGNADNGKEGFIIKGRLVEPGNIYSVPVIYTLEPVDPNNPGEDYYLNPWYVEEPNCMPYVCQYSNSVVLDRNGDGFDDFVLKLVEKASIDDVIYFQNTAEERSMYGGARFAFAPGRHEILIDDEGVELRLDMADADDDGNDELIAGLNRKDPPDDPNGTYKTIYYEIFEESFHPETFPGDFEGDYDVDFIDFTMFASHWLCEPGQECWDCNYDVSCTPDDEVDFKDLKRFVYYWLENF
jgi:hypothetical protein